MKLWRKIVGAVMFPVMIVTLSGCVSGCTDQDLQDIEDIATIWAKQHGLMNEKGELQPVAFGARVTADQFMGNYVDPVEAAIVDAGPVVQNFHEAEKLSEEAMQTGDVSKVDEAIKKRPGEFRYHNQKGAMLLFSNSNGWEDSFTEADNIAARYDRSTQLRNLDSQIEYLDRERVHNGVTGDDPEDNGVLIKYYFMMYKSYYQRFQLTGDQKDKNTYEEYRKQYFLHGGG